MDTQVVARLRCTHIIDHGSFREVFFEAAYSEDKTSPNYSFSQATPQASLRMVITNPDAFNYFEPKKLYNTSFDLALVQD